MANLDSSLASTLVLDNSDLMGLDPIEGRALIHRVLNACTDGKIFNLAIKRNVNTDCDIIVLRDRLERYEIRRYYGKDSAAWNFSRDEITEPSLQMEENLQSPLNSTAQKNVESTTFLSRLVSPLRREVTHLEKTKQSSYLPTGQSIGRFQDPLSFGDPEPTYKSMLEMEIRPANLELENTQSTIETETADRRRNQLFSGSQQNSSYNRNQVNKEITFPSMIRNIEPAINPQAQSTRVTLSPLPEIPHQDPNTVQDHIMDFTGPITGSNPTTTYISQLSGEHSHSMQHHHGTKHHNPLQQTQYLKLPPVTSQHVNAQNSNTLKTSHYITNNPTNPVNNTHYVHNASLPTNNPAQNPLRENMTVPPYSNVTGNNYYGYSQNIYRPTLSENTNVPAIPNPVYIQQVPWPPLNNVNSQPFIPYTNNCNGPPSLQGPMCFQGYPQLTQPAPIQYPENQTLPTSHMPSSIDSPAFLREIRTCEILQKWQISFKGINREDPEEFLARLADCKYRYNLNLNDLIRALPTALDADGGRWFRQESRNWHTYEDLEQAFRLQYCVEDIQERLVLEIDRRTQGPKEDISTYLMKLRSLLDKRIPAMPLNEQLNRAYGNLHPSYKLRISRDQFRTFPELQKLGKKEESRRIQAQAYRPPPTSEESWFQFAVCEDDKYRKPKRVAAVNEKHNVAKDEVKKFPSTNQVDQNLRQNDTNLQVHHTTGSKKKDINTPKSKITPKEWKLKRESEPCFRCNKMGHWSKECPEKQLSGYDTTVPATQQNSSKKSSEQQGNGKGRT